MWGCTYNGAGIGHWFFGGGIMGFLIMALIAILITTLVIKLIRSNKAVRKNDNSRMQSVPLGWIKYPMRGVGKGLA